MTATLALRDDGRRAGVDLTAMTNCATESIVAADALWRAVADELDDLLRARIDGFRNRLATMLGLVAVALVFVRRIARGITMPLAAMHSAAQALAAGDFDVALSACGRRDEIGRMADVLHALARGLAEAQ
jgi:methyl-accepting chemotaxis protein